MLLCKNRDEWRAVRSTGIGASEAAAILGVSPWKGALQLFHEKRGAQPPPSDEEFARRLGLALEDPIADLFRQETGRVVTRPAPGSFMVHRHAQHPMMLATLDGMVNYRENEADPLFSGQSGVLEIKTAAISKIGSWREEPPIDYQVQVQHQLAVTGLRVGSIVALIGGVHVKYADLKRDEEFIALLEAACEEFWRRVELNDPPPPDGTEATKAFLKSLYPDAKPTSIALGPEAIEWDQQRVAAAEEIKRQEARKLEAENRLKVAIGENVQGVLPNGVIYTWKPQKRQGYTVKPTEFRDFRRKDPNAKKAGPRQSGAPKLDVGSIAEEYRAEQAAEASVAEDFEF